MNRLIIAGFAAIAVLAAATTMLRSHSLTGSHAVTTGMASPQQRQTSTVVNKLPIEEFEDMSLVYSNSPKR